MYELILYMYSYAVSIVVPFLKNPTTVHCPIGQATYYEYN